MKLPGRGRAILSYCTLRRWAWVPKDSPRITWELQKIVESQSQKTLKIYNKIKQHLHHMLFGWVSRKKKLRKENAFIQTQSSAYSVVRHDWNFKWDWLLWSDVKKKLLFSKHSRWFVEHRDKKYPMCTMKYTAVFFMFWAYISAGGPGHLVQTHGIMDSIKYQQIQKSVRNLIVGHVWYSQPGNNPKTNLRNNSKKWVTWYKTKHLLYGHYNPLTWTLL